MKGTIKRFTSIMLTLLMTLALLPMEVLAAENVSDFTQLTELTSEAQIASTPAIQPLADAATAVLATFSVGSQTYSDLNDAITAAQSGTDKTIVVATDGSLSGSYTIPAGVTLLVPFDGAKTLYKETPKATRKVVATKAYRKLVLSAGASLNVEGAISVGGQYYSAGGSQIGGMVGNYGHLWLNTGAAITVKSGGALYAWGFVSGNGAVAAESGAKVYEWFQIGDFRGGRASACMGNRVFPFSQYFIQNIESPLTIYSGAEEILYTDIYASESQNGASVTFIGNSGMFKVFSGSLTKQYDAAQDRMVYTVNGKAELNSLSINSGALSVNSSEYVLPITNNMTLHITPRSSITTNQDIALLPGVQVYVDKAAELTIAAGKKAYIYDSDQWTDQNYVNPNAKFKSVLYSPTKSYTRTNADLVDALVDVNGTLIAAGAIYTTKNGADVCSSQKTGRYIMKATSGTETNTYQYTQSGSNVTAHDIGIDPIRLKNDDGSYTATKGKAQDQYNFEVDKWLKCQRLLVIFDPNYTGAQEIEVQKVAPSTATPLLSNPFTREGYNFTGWTTKANGTGTSYADGAKITLTADTTLYAQWSCSHAITEVRDAQDATCTAHGYTGDTYCTVCNEKVKEGEVIPAKGHTKVIDPAVEPTCTAPGKTEGAHCEVCGATLIEQTVISVKGHSWNEGEITTSPTCENAGVKTYTCTVCNATKTEAIDATGHTPVEVAEQPATCTEAGHTAGTKCSVCDAILSGMEEIPATGHTEVIDAAKAPTCTETGLTEGKHCSVCGTVIKAQEEIPANGHSWNEGEITTSPTCENAGVKTYTCTVCNATKTEAIDATGHTPVEVAEQPATCTEAGHTAGTKCSVCDAILSGMEEIPATGHTEVIDAAKAPTCTETGLTEGKHCSVCGTVIKAQEVIPAIGHKPEIRNAVEATLTTPGYTGDTYCSVCNELLKQGEEIPKTGAHITWVIDGKVVAEEDYLKGTMPSFKGSTDKAPDENYRYTFTGWSPEVVVAEEDATYTAQYSATARVFYTITFNANGGEGSMEPQRFEVGVDTALNTNAFTRESYNFIGWNTAADGSGATYADEGAILELTGDMTLYAQWQFWNGWFTDDNGKQYYKDGELQKTGWTVIDGNTYYLDTETGYAATGIATLVPDGATEEARCVFDAEGVFQSDVTGVYSVGNDTYWLNGGIIEEEAGLKRVVKENGEINYYYFGKDGKACKANADTKEYTVEKNNGYGLPEGNNYRFDKSGVIEHFVGCPNGIYYDEATTSYYYCVDGVIIANGLMEIDGSYYYARTSTGAFVRNQTYWVTKTNGLLTEGNYTFDNKGKIVFSVEPEKKNGIVEENGSLYYYVDGVLTGAGLIKIGDDYYYVKTSSGEVVHGRRYWITVTNRLLPAGIYNFDKHGRMTDPPTVDPDQPTPEVKNGIVEENGSLYYYVDGVLTGAGLIKIGDDYYYVKTSSGEVVHGRRYWITATNGLPVKAGWYQFTDDGKMLIQ